MVNVADFWLLFAPLFFLFVFLLDFIIYPFNPNILNGQDVHTSSKEKAPTRKILELLHRLHSLQQSTKSTIHIFVQSSAPGTNHSQGDKQVGNN
jgi:hypothetical protein